MKELADKLAALKRERAESRAKWLQAMKDRRKEFDETMAEMAR